jgi:hypothetical protein
MVKKFVMKHLVFKRAEPEEFDETTAPDWLTSNNTIKGSTMDNRWFWDDYVLKLKVGKSIDTDFHRITRIA